MEHHCILMRYELLVESPVGILTMKSDGDNLTELCFGDHREGLDACPVLAHAAEQLAEYFSGSRREFSVPLKAEGTEFQRAVWAALRTIPYGTTATYADIARTVGNEKACRAVGGANNRNPIAIIVPCHRVIGSKGTLIGYAGGIEVKEYLLRLEDKHK